MKGFSPLPVIMLMAGIILIYSSIKDVSPKTVIQNALQGKASPSATPTPAVKPPPSGFQPGAGAGGGGGGGGGGSW
jgi:hypothetical protein